jgi:23S rRNA pseudouridine1911/1915/1917 synthase
MRPAVAGPREFVVDEASALDGAIRRALGLSWGQARRLVEQGKVSVEGGRVVSPTFRVRAGTTVRVDPAARRLPAERGLDPERIVYADAHVVVVDKPPGVSTVPYEEGERGTLDELVRRVLGARGGTRGVAPSLGVVHRLDKETSGLVVFTRSWLAKQSLASQFRAHTVTRRYLAIAHGRVPACTIESHLVADRGDGLRGSLERLPARMRAGREGQRAVTHVEPLEALREGDLEATLVSCRLETGRTHQIRIHLAERGHPLLGERVYGRPFAGRSTHPEIPAPRVMLHATLLGFVHPKTGKPMEWTLPPPEDFVRVLRRLAERPA